MLDDALKVVAAVVLAILGIAFLVHVKEAHADYVLQFVLNTGEVMTAKRYKGSDAKAEELCLTALYKAKVEENVKSDRDLYVKSGGCVPCDEFPSQCQEGI